MSDPSKPAFHEIPAPPSNFARENTIAPNGRRSIATIAKRWLPQNVSLETLIATVSRYANRLIDRTTGIPYSADELETKILNAGVTNINGDVAVGTTATHSIGDGTHYLLNLYATTLYSSGVVAGYTASGAVAGAVIIYSDSSGNNTTLTSTATSGRAVTFPDAEGSVGVLRTYADSTAANAVVSIGDAWWDTTLNKARVRLS